ncbi:MAG: hypothetical protein J6M03_04755 [Clostridia bacterium]|nr:hypothetical protein [Clostridia bacterium]
MKKKILKIGALVLATLLIVGVCLFANSLIGNPISKALAKNTAEKYLEENYPDTDFELGEVNYSFKDSYYHAHVSSPSSMDSSFTLLINGLGKLRYDYYENNVTNGWNTAYRLRDDYREAVDALLESSSFGYNVILGYGDIAFVAPEDKEILDPPSYAIDTSELELDAYYNVSEFGARAGKLTLHIGDNTVSNERMAEILLGIRKCFDEAKIGFFTIDCVLEYSQDDSGNYKHGRVEVNEFLYEDIYEEGLVERVSKAAEAAENYYYEADDEKLFEEAE